MITNTDIINKIGALMPNIWGSVSTTVSEACGFKVTFADPLTVATNAQELGPEMTAPMLVIQFSFSGSPDRVQLLLLDQNTLASFASLIKGSDIDEVDDNLVVDIRPQLESIIQGVCLAAGNVRQEPVVASGISIRFQNVAFPPNFNRSELMVRTQVAIQAEEVSGTLGWLVDADTAIYILGQDSEEEETDQPFLQLESGQLGAAPGGPSDDGTGLGILMDIPLEISVELGRVRMFVRDILELGPGSIVEIDKAAGEPVDVMVNGRLVARGEVVVIEDNFGVRITEVCNAMERLTRLNEAA